MIPTNTDVIMKYIFAGILGIALTPLALSQTTTPAPHASGGKDMVNDKKIIMEPEKPNGLRFWVNLDSQIWWVKAAPVSVPTLTTFAPGSTSASTGFGGQVGVDGTRVLSPDHLGYDPFVGGNVDIGGWLDSGERLGLDAGGLLLENQSSSYSDYSGGSPPLRVPFENVPPGDGAPVGKSSFVLSNPGRLSIPGFPSLPGLAKGGQSLYSSLHLWGVEGNALFHLSASPRLDLSVSGGFRYLNLKENLTIKSDQTEPGLGLYQATDMFTTRNQFGGFQLGAKAESHLGRFDVSMIAKFALGDDYETVTINGSSVVTYAGTVTSTPGGIFTQKTNIGRRTYNEFCVVPEGQFQLGYNVTNTVRVYAGYDILFLDNVARPGDQIDRTINFTGNSVVNETSKSTLVGARRPQASLNTSSFWAQGITTGVEFKF